MLRVADYVTTTRLEMRSEPSRTVVWRPKEIAGTGITGRRSFSVDHYGGARPVSQLSVTCVQSCRAVLARTGIQRPCFHFHP
jgi:hypothetical protein